MGNARSELDPHLPILAPPLLILRPPFRMHSGARREGGRESVGQASSYTHADNDQLCMNYDALSFTYAAADAAARSAQRRFESSPDC